MKYLLLLAIVSVYLSTVQAQEKSDPDAMAILENLKKDYDSNGDHIIEFELEIEYPGESNQNYKGSLLQSGDKFALDLGDKLVVSDDVTVWLYLKERNELQINDADFGDEGEYMSPNTVFNLYQSNDFLFAISNQFNEGSAYVTQIECKPLDDDSEYSKMRLTIEDTKNRVKRFKIFSKDGSRFTMKMIDHKKNQKLPVTTFSFDPSKYANIIVEDLRF